jgi:dihydroneopterin aldolase
MGLMEVNGIRVFAYHGCLEEEAASVATTGWTSPWRATFSTAPRRSDRLEHAVDYGRVTAIVKEQMAVRANLIEHVARGILDALKAEWESRVALACTPGEGASTDQWRCGPKRSTAWREPEGLVRTSYLRSPLSRSRGRVARHSSAKAATAVRIRTRPLR